MFLGIGIIVLGIFIIILKIAKIIPTDGAVCWGLLISIAGIFSCNNTYKTQKDFQKHFQKNESDKAEIEAIRKDFLK